jgi:hypothetical protein
MWNNFEDTRRKLCIPHWHFLCELILKFRARRLLKLSLCLFEEQANVGLDPNRNITDFLQTLIIMWDPAAFFVMFSQSTIRNNTISNPSENRTNNRLSAQPTGSFYISVNFRLWFLHLLIIFILESFSILLVQFLL